MPEPHAANGPVAAAPESQTGARKRHRSRARPPRPPPPEPRGEEQVDVTIFVQTFEKPAKLE